MESQQTILTQVVVVIILIHRLVGQITPTVVTHNNLWVIPRWIASEQRGRNVRVLQVSVICVQVQNHVHTLHSDIC